MYLAGGVAYMGCGSVRVDVAYWGGGCDMYVTNARVGDGHVCDGYARRGGADGYGRRGVATARKRS